MTTDRLELLLAFGIVAVYLLDALRFLRPREALVERLAPDRWRVLFGAVRFELLARRPALANPLRPDRISYLARWRIPAGPAEAPVAWPEASRGAVALGRLCLASFVAGVVAAPLLLLAGRQLWFAATIGIAYLVALAAGILLVVRAADFGLGRWPAAGLAAIAVICLPCAPNLLRAACGNRTLSVELPAFAEASAGAAERHSFGARFARVLRAELVAGSDDPREDEALKRVLARMEARS